LSFAASITMRFSFPLCRISLDLSADIDPHTGRLSRGDLIIEMNIQRPMHFGLLTNDGGRHLAASIRRHGKTRRYQPLHAQGAGICATGLGNITGFSVGHALDGNRRIAALPKHSLPIICRVFTSRNHCVALMYLLITNSQSCRIVDTDIRRKSLERHQLSSEVRSIAPIKNVERLQLPLNAKGVTRTRSISV